MSFGKGMYVHQFDQLAERTAVELAATLVSGGVDEVRFKTHQWLTWTGTPRASGDYDRAPHAVKGLGDVAALRDVFAAAGIRTYPWCCPMGLDVEAEAQRAAEVARVCGRLDFDVEPYAEFWPGIARGDYSAVGPFFERVRQLVGDSVELTLDLPARDTSWEWGHMRRAVELAAPFVDRLALQSYFGTAQAEDAEQRVAQVAAGRPVEHIAGTSTLGPMLAWLQGRQAARVLVWRAPDMNGALYAQLAAASFPGPVAGPPTPEPAPGATWQQPGFIAMSRRLADVMGDPLGEPYPDQAGNVWQLGASGRAVWVKAYNRNFWLGADGQAAT